MADDNIKRRSEMCSRCDGERHSRINMATGHCIVTMPSRCERKDDCAREMVPTINLISRRLYGAADKTE